MLARFKAEARKILHRDLQALVDSMWGDDWPVERPAQALARKPLYDLSRPEVLTLASELLDKPDLVPRIAPIVRMLEEQNMVLLRARTVPHRLRDRAHQNKLAATYLAGVWLPCMLDPDEGDFGLALDAADAFLNYRLLDKPFRQIAGSGRRGDGYLGHYYPVVGAIGALIDPASLDGPKLARVATLLNALVPESNCSYLRATVASIALGIGHRHSAQLAADIARQKGEKAFLKFLAAVLRDRDASVNPESHTEVLETYGPRIPAGSEPRAERGDGGVGDSY